MNISYKVEQWKGCGKEEEEDEEEEDEEEEEEEEHICKNLNFVMDMSTTPLLPHIP